MKIPHIALLVLCCMLTACERRNDVGACNATIWRVEILPADAHFNLSVRTRIRCDLDNRRGMTFRMAMDELTQSGLAGMFDGITLYPLLKDDGFQNEIFTELERLAPRQLAEAMASAGNMHNPKMIQLQKPFAQALLTTPTVRGINAELAARGWQVSGAGAGEKFSLDGNKGGPRRFEGTPGISIARIPAKTAEK
jgi:hypothetical protein